MAKWNILLTDGLEKNGKAILQKEANFNDHKGIPAEDLLTIIGNYDAVIVRGRTKITSKVIDKASQLKVIGRCGVGVDNIDTEYAKDNGIVVVNAPTATSRAVAELSIALILALAREISLADSSMKKGDWKKKELMGSELDDKVLGVIGYGRIGSIIGKIARGFGMRVLGCCHTTPAEVIAERGGEAASFEELLAISDFISVNTPLTEKTKNLLDAKAFTKMKAGVRIITTARGGIVNEEALLNAIQSNKVAGAALDVFSNEPPGLSDLIKHPKVIATPHIGGQTIEAQKRAAVDIAEEVLSALNGNPLRWRIA